MPTVLRIGGYRFYFFSNEGDEPPHVHVEHGERCAKFWLLPEPRIEWAKRFRRHEQRKLLDLVEQHQIFFLEKWNEHFETEA